MIKDPVAIPSKSNIAGLNILLTFHLLVIIIFISDNGHLVRRIHSSILIYDLADYLRYHFGFDGMADHFTCCNGN
jgi:hypothetical protein